MTCTRLSSAGRKPAYRHSSRNRYSNEIQREVQVGNSDQKRTQGSDYPPRHRPRYRRCGRPLRDAGRLGHAYGDADHCLGGKVGQWLPLVPDFQHSDIVVAGGAASAEEHQATLLTNHCPVDRQGSQYSDQGHRETGGDNQAPAVAMQLQYPPPH